MYFILKLLDMLCQVFHAVFVMLGTGACYIIWLPTSVFKIEKPLCCPPVIEAVKVPPNNIIVILQSIAVIPSGNEIIYFWKAYLYI